MTVGQDEQHHILAVCTEWDSSHGGLPTFNRELCLSLAGQGARVVCIVLSATETEKQQARAGGVTLVEASARGEISETLAMARKPTLPAGFSPTIIIGHARVTGPVAKALHEDHFPQARRLHVVHMAPDEIEWHKLGRGDDAATRAEERTEFELQLARDAHRVVAVGPRLFHRLQNDLVPDDIVPVRLDPGFDGTGATTGPRSAPAGLCRVLLFGRTEDADLKGLDIAAQAMGQALRWRGRPTPDVEFVIRGAPAASGEELRRRVRDWAQMPALNVVVRPYTRHSERLTADLRRASLVLMPSRTEGFGLAGLEAIVAGTPALISASSGLGALLEDVLTDDEAQRVVVSMADHDHDLVDRWARAIEAVLRDREAAFRRAAEIRTQLANRRTWSRAAQQLLKEVGRDDPAAARHASALSAAHRQSLVDMLARVDPPALAAACGDAVPEAAGAGDWRDPAGAVQTLERLPAPTGKPPKLFVFVEHLAHVRDRREFKALHEWIDQAGGAAGLDQEAMRAICREERQRSGNMARGNSAMNSALGGEESASNGDPVSKTSVLDKKSVDPSRAIDDRPQIRGNIPIRNPDFTGRDDLLDSLRRTLRHSQKASVLPRALYGLGGVGKTQLALEYVYRYSDEYDLTWWIPAEQKSLALASLAQLCAALGMTENVDQQQTADAVLRELGKGNRRWLLVFDNADDPEEILKLVPSRGGHVIITSRNPEWSHSSEAIEVDVFVRGESIALLRKGTDEISAAEADRLAAKLGDLPLALDQARNWQQATHMSVDEYLELFEGHARDLMSEGKPPWYPRTVAAFVSLALEKLQSDNPAVAQLLSLFAFLGAEPFSMEVLRRAREAKISDPLRPVLRSPINLSRTIRNLRRFGLAKVDADQNTQVHRLVQLVLREELSEELLARSKRDVQLIFATANPADPDNTRRYREVYQDFGPHIIAADLVNSDVEGARQVVLDQIRYLYVTGDYEGSRRLGELVVRTWTAASGPEVGPQGELTLIAKRHLANALRDLGEKDHARELDQEVYHLLEQSPEFGPDHDHTLATAMSVAVDLRLAGKYGEALAVDDANVIRHQEVFGETDPLTLRARSNRAVNQRMLGDFAGALEVDEELTDEWRKAVGEDDARYMFAITNRALDLNGRGRYAEALDSLNRIFGRYRELQGSGHLFVLRAARALGVALRKTGQYATALTWAEENFTECESRLGLNTEQTLAAAMTYANTLRVNGRLVEAREQAIEAVRRYHATFGDHHPLTLVAEANLAIIYRVLGETREAYKIDRAVLDDMTRLLGADHGYTLCVANSVGNDLVLAHEVTAARDLSKKTLEISRRVRGDLHPYTLSCAVNAALDQQTTGQEADGLALLDATVAHFSKVLGPDHPETVDAGRFKRAECDIEPPPA